MHAVEHSLYHSSLRVAAATLACTLLFVSGVLHPITSQLAVETEQYVATAVGATAGVAPTELNQITAALTEQRRDLDEREAALNERELSLGLNRGGAAQAASLTTWLNSALLFIVLTLMVINYVLDFSYRRRTASAVHNA